MATFIPTAGAVRVDLTSGGAEGSIHNIYWFTRAAAWTQPQRDALNTALQTWWSASMAPLLSGDTALSSIDIVNQDAQNSPGTVYAVSPTIPGTVGGGAYPEGTAICIGLRTALRGRNYRGRSYISGIPLSKRYTDGTATAAYVSDLITALNALIGVISGLGAVWVVVSKYLNGVARPAGVATPITAIVADTAFDSQRRRLFGRGS